MSNAYGAYGIGLVEFPSGRFRLSPIPLEWPTWRLTFRRSSQTDVNRRVVFRDDSRATFRFGERLALEIDRGRREGVLIGPDRPHDAAWVHPILSPLAILAADWRGDLAFHASAFLDSRNRTWGVLGDRNAGKTSFAMWLEVHGHTVYADDLLVTDGDVAYVGPRCLDLRESSYLHFARGHALPDTGDRERYRVDLAPLHLAESRIAGFISLSWSREPRSHIRELHGLEKVDAVQAGRALLASQQHSIPWLRIFGLPVLAFSRPRDLNALDKGMHEVLEYVARM